MSDRISHYVQSERTFTEDELDELKELIERMKQEPLMFLEPLPEPPLPPMREQLAIKWNRPSKDMVEVVRCKDCKHYQFADNRAFGFPVKRCEWTGFEDMDNDDFCSRGERKDV